MSTKPTSQPPHVHELLSQDRWIRRLATGLLHDPDRADDAVQDAWVSALERSPEKVWDPRAWFTRVVHNKGVSKKRSEARRADREETVARREATASADTIVSQVELQKNLAQALHALDEPYRTAVALRYFEDLPPRKIASEMKAPIETVRTWIYRGLAKLRQELDAEYGDRRTWALGLVGIARRGLAAKTAAAGSLWLATKWVGGAAAVVLAALVLTRSDESGEPELERVVPSVAATKPGAEAAPIEEPRTERTIADPVSPEVAVDATEAAAPSTAFTFEGRVVDERGEGVEGLRVVFDDRDQPSVLRSGGRIRASYRNAQDQVVMSEIPAELQELLRQNPADAPKLLADCKTPEILASMILGTYEPEYDITGPSGRFRLEVPHENGVLDIEEDDWWLFGPLRANGEKLLVVVPMVSVSGIVEDENGVPVPRAEVGVSAMISGLHHFPFDFTGDAHRTWNVRTDAQGRFEKHRVPHIDGRPLVATHPEHESNTAPIPASGAHDLRLVLVRKPETTPQTVSGLVVDVMGSPVEGARVCLGQDNARTDGSGRFSFDISSLYRKAPLLAMHDTKGVAMVEGVGARMHASGASEEFVLRLDATEREIVGSVVDGNGDPLEGLRIALVDCTPWGSSSSSLESMWGQQHDHNEPDPWSTDERGMFRIDRLLDRTYRLRIADDEGRVIVTQELEPNGALLEWTLDDSSRFDRITGRVQDHEGNAISEARVTLSRIQTTGHGGYSIRRVASTTADEQGDFELENVAREGVYLTVGGQGVRGKTFRELAIQEHNVLVAETHGRVRVDLPSGSAIDGVEFQDAEGEPVAFMAKVHTAISYMERMKPRDGLLPVCEVPGHVTDVVFFANDVEVSRRPLSIHRSKLTVIVP